MLRFIIIIIIDFYSAYLKKNIGAKAKKRRKELLLITGRKHSPPICTCIKSLQTCDKTERYATTMDMRPSGGLKYLYVWSNDARKGKHLKL